MGKLIPIPRVILLLQGNHTTYTIPFPIVYMQQNTILKKEINQHLYISPPLTFQQPHELGKWLLRNNSLKHIHNVPNNYLEA